MPPCSEREGVQVAAGGERGCGAVAEVFATEAMDCTGRKAAAEILNELASFFAGMITRRPERSPAVERSNYYFGVCVIKYSKSLSVMKRPPVGLK